MDCDHWKEGVCAICNTQTSVHPFKAHEARNAPPYWACARCYLKRLDERR